jgi:ribonuclease Z
MMRFGTGFDISHLFVTHLHGDHVLGIPGLIQTVDFNNRTDALALYGPPGSKPHLRSLIEVGGFSPSFPVTITEVRPGTTALSQPEYEVRGFETAHRGVRSVGYALVESERKGRFDRERALELGVPEGPLFGKLHEGMPVELDDGSVVEPEQVVGPPRPGRRFVYTGDTRPTETTIEHATDADLLIHDATFDGQRAERAQKTGHSTAREAAEIANRAGAKRLALTHISSRYAADASTLEREAQSKTAQTEAFIPDDGAVLKIPYPDNSVAE